MVSRLRQDVSGKVIIVEDLSTQAESLQDNIQELNKQISSQDEQFQQTKFETENKFRVMEDSHSQACLELERWRTSAEELQARVTLLTKQLDENKDSKLVEDLRKALSEKEHQVAQLSKEKHLYQLELMNRNCHGDSVTARQRRKSGRGKPSKPGPSRGHK